MSDQTNNPNSKPDLMHQCNLCPRECGADRVNGKLGYCRTNSGLPISSICCHLGEEPVLSGSHGICNVFFAHCNLQCIYCQNHQISSNRGGPESSGMLIEEVVSQIETILRKGARGVGFVSPSHCLTQMKSIMTALNERGINPIFVYNTNSYDRVEMIRGLEGSINVYVPDLKYMDDELAKAYSDVTDYVGIASKALIEMHRQKGSDIELDSDGYISSGLIVRHLVLPGHVDNSIAVLRFIAKELSVDVHVSLMAQYHPTPAVKNHPELHRFLRVEEYDSVIREFERLGFYRGWVQDLNSSSSYLPDFDNDHPFEA